MASMRRTPAVRSTVAATSRVAPVVMTSSTKIKWRLAVSHVLFGRHLSTVSSADRARRRPAESDHGAANNPRYGQAGAPRQMPGQ